MGKVLEYHCWNYREDIYLVDMIFDMNPNEIDIYEMVVPEQGEQRRFWQFPFLYQFLSLDGTKLVCSWCGKPPVDMKPCRMVFLSAMDLMERSYRHPMEISLSRIQKRHLRE